MIKQTNNWLQQAVTRFSIQPVNLNQIFFTFQHNLHVHVTILL